MLKWNKIWTWFGLGPTGRINQMSKMGTDRSAHRQSTVKYEDLCM